MNELSSFRKLNTKLLRTQTSEVLREAILTGRFQLGQKLNEKQISEELGISRGPLRETFLKLEHEGIVQIIPHRGTYVIHFRTQDIINVLTFRELVEPFAMKNAMQNGKSGLIEELSIRMEEMRLSANQDNYAGVASAHARFHGAFYNQSGYILLERIWDILEGPLRLYLLMHQTTFSNLLDVVNEHEYLLQLAIDGDIIRMDNEIHKHLRINLKQLISTSKTS